MKRNKSGAVPMTSKMSEENYDAPAATKVCRICLAMDTKMYNITESKLDIMFQDITGLVGWSERLPQRVCWECAARLSSAYHFREKALRSDELLQELIQPYSYIKIRDIKLINRTKYKLTSNLIHEVNEADDFNLHIQDRDMIEIERLSVPEIIEFLPADAVEIMDVLPVKTRKNSSILPAKSKRNIDRFLYADSQKNIDILPAKSTKCINILPAKSSNNIHILPAISTKYFDIMLANSSKCIEIIPAKSRNNVDLLSTESKKNRDVLPAKSKSTKNNVCILPTIPTNNIDNLPATSTNNIGIIPAKCTKNIDILPTDSNDIADLPTATKIVEINDDSSDNFPFDAYEQYERLDDEDEYFSDVSVEKTIEEIPKEKKKLYAVKQISTEDVVQTDFPPTTREQHKIEEDKRTSTNGFDESLFTIRPLTYDEQIAEINKRQKSTNYINSIFKCELCYRGFMSETTYTTHALRHSEQSGTFECSICKRRLKTKKALQKHLALHTLQYSCNSCSFVAKSRYVAREHQKLHAGHKYQCRHCPRQFTKSSSYLSHLRLKHVSDIACEMCGYMFVSKYGLEMHKRLKHSLIGKDVTLDGPYCQICDVKFASEEAHDRHLKLSAKHRTEHGSKPPRNQMTYRRPVQTQHQRIRRINDSIPINCEQCGEVQRNMISYAQHFRRLHPEKVRTKYPTMKTPSMCDQCGKIFANNICLEYHKWVHTGVKKFQCDLCKKKFTQKPSLMFHMKSHKGVTYECSMCDKQFTHPNNRNRHVKSVHIGARPYKCHTCNKSFTTSGGLKGHVEHVHRNVPWPKRTRPSRVSKKKCEEPSIED
ncbi:unnamed protein product [Spodoptera littoralis]|uniref:Uncharacterized protein n=1 Tax=Spodoptera littoralis TaxID=7109 RepID=A0A9P0I9Q0_SPOLI|nr:unnamed protein product [Spodoptera littoralis]CAH1642777.1 unnamed protein product [Spodoptera littoralis]